MAMADGTRKASRPPNGFQLPHEMQLTYGLEFLPL